MSFSFRLKYLLGLIPSTQKLDAAWDNLVSMRDNLEKIKTSSEFERYNELKSLIESEEFQRKKRDIIRLDFNSSEEFKLLNELKNLESRPNIKQYNQLVNSHDLDKFRRVADSDKLRRYNELRKLVESPEFIKRKKEVESLDYKLSPEHKLEQDYLELKNSDRLKSYYKTISSPDYLLFLELDPVMNGHSGKFPEDDPKVKIYRKFLQSKDYENIKAVENQKLTEKFEQLKLEINSKQYLQRVAFLKDPKRYETTPDFTLLNEYHSLEKSEEIKYYNSFSNSPIYRNYLQLKESGEFDRFEKLKKQTASDEFKQRVAYLKNKKRYATTGEYKQEMAFKELEKGKLVSDYRKLKNAKALDFFRKWSLAFEDEFLTNSLNLQAWQPENYWGFKMAGTSFSQENEMQCYNGLKNIQVNNNTLSIVTKKEKVNGMFWNPSVGLVPKQFDYSSAMLNTSDHFRIEQGIVEAKVRFNGDPSITNAISLTGGKPFPQIDLFRSGNGGLGLGIIDKTGIHASPYYKKIGGLNKSKYHIFRLEILTGELIWKINGYEVYRERFSPIAGGLFLNVVSSLHAPVNEQLLPHRFEIDWVRCFVAKN